MRAIILAAGMGRRLSSLTKDQPKCLLHFGGRSLLSRYMTALEAVGVERASIVVGHLSHLVKQEVESVRPRMSIRFVTNDQYHRGSIYSLWMAKDECDDDVLIMDADVLFPIVFLHRLLSSGHHTAVLVDQDVKQRDEEQMAVVWEGRVLALTKVPESQGRCKGESVGILKIAREHVGRIGEALQPFIKDGVLDMEYEDALGTFFQSVHVGYEEVGGLPWIEIDFIEDVQRAEKEILPLVDHLDRVTREWRKERKSEAMTPEDVQPIIEREYDYFMSEHEQWSPTRGDHDLELVAHALRVLIHKGKVDSTGPEFIALGAQQNEDGGWGQRGSDKDSKIWVSAFCALILIRGNQLLNYERLAGSVQMATRYFLDAQHPDGRWVDSSWADLDATSHPVSFFNVFLVLGKAFGKRMRTKVEDSWKRGMQFILDRQAPDGGWYDEAFHPTGVEITAHIIQDSLVADVMIENVMGVSRPCLRGVDRLIALQAETGSWDNDNVDHTMDCTRSLMLVSRMLGIEKRCDPAVQKGMEWIIKAKNEHGWPDFPGMESNLERTCDGLDTMLKYLAYSEDDPMRIMKYWGYIE